MDSYEYEDCKEIDEDIKNKGEVLIIIDDFINSCLNESAKHIHKVFSQLSDESIKKLLEVSNEIDGKGLNIEWGSYIKSRHLNDWDFSDISEDENRVYIANYFSSLIFGKCLEKMEDYKPKGKILLEKEG